MRVNRGASSEDCHSPMLRKTTLFLSFLSFEVSLIYFILDSLHDTSFLKKIVSPPQIDDSHSKAQDTVSAVVLSPGVSGW